MNELVQVASQYGALGLMLIASFWYINKKDKEHISEINKMEERFGQQHMEAFGVTNKNTQALEKLSSMIERIVNK